MDDKHSVLQLSIFIRCYRRTSWHESHWGLGKSTAGATVSSAKLYLYVICWWAAKCFCFALSLAHSVTNINTKHNLLIIRFFQTPWQTYKFNFYIIWKFVEDILIRLESLLKDL